MTRFTFPEPETEFGRARAMPAPWRPIDAIVWAGTAVLVAAAACAVGLFAGRHLPVEIGGNLDDRPVELARMMAVLGGVYGLLAGGAAGLLRGRPNRIATGLKGGLGFALMGALAGGSGPLLSAVTGGQLPMAGAVALVCAATGGVTGLIAYTLRRPSSTLPGGVEDDWSADRALADRHGPPAVAPGVVVRQWPILLVSAACLVVAIITPPSPAGWPMIAIGLLGFAVAWVLAGQERRLRVVEHQFRQRDRGESDRAPDDRPAG